jgi:KaiC/GvpD/RAD55 family RecA-like ATPase
MADVARRGRLAVYFSLEEDKGTLVDRLVAFGLTDPEHYDMIDGEDYRNIGAEIKLRLQRESSRGLLIFYGSDRKKYDLGKVIGEIAAAATGRWNWRSLTIDSVNALYFGFHSLRPDTNQHRFHRGNLEQLIRIVEDNKFLGIILGEKNSQEEFDKLPYVADTMIRLEANHDEGTRCLQVLKCRGQGYHQGRHPFRISEGRGIVIYPSLGAISTTLRKRVKTTTSENRLIRLPVPLVTLGLPKINEKASILIWGTRSASKVMLGLTLLTEPALAVRESSEEQSPDSQPDDELSREPKKLLVITFRTPEVKFEQRLRALKHLTRRWERVPSTAVRWFSPGENFTGEQLIWELLRLLQEARREGTPIERILFDELDTAEDFLPAVARDPLFWPVLLEVVTTEPVTTVFVMDEEDQRSRLFRMLRSTTDYGFRVSRSADNVAGSWIQVDKRPPGIELSGKTHRSKLQMDYTGAFSGEPD